MIFHPFPVLETNRLVLCEVTEQDSPEMLFLRSDETANKYIDRPEKDVPENESDILAFIKKLDDGLKAGQLINWGISEKGNAEIIGTICLWNISDDRKVAEAGYGLHPDFYRKGIMSEAIASVIDYGFNQMALEKIEAFTHRENVASVKLLERHGFILNPSRSDEHNANNIIFEIESKRK